MEETTNAKDKKKSRLEKSEKKIKRAKKSKDIDSDSGKGLIVKRLFTVLFYLGTIVGITVMVLLYGPYNGFRDWLITTAMKSMTHQYFATFFFDDETIEEVMSNNKVVEIDENTDQDAIQISSTKKSNYADEYEREILERDDDNNDYKIISISGKTYDGYLVAVYDPSRIKVCITEKLGFSGQYLTTMAQNKDALIAVNGGGFNDPNFNSTGGSPLGITCVNGNYMTTDSYAGTGGIIGFTEDDKLYLGKVSLAEAKKQGIRDAVTFGPFLIVNGKASEIVGNGGWGKAPRTVIAQRKDGVVLFLVLDGRKGTKQGADMDDLIEILQRYGAYNAANLDGGTSSVLVVNGTIVNDPIDSTGAHKTRPISTGFYLEPDDSDDSDHSIVEDKLED